MAVPSARKICRHAPVSPSARIAGHAEQRGDADHELRADADRLGRENKKDEPAA